MVAWIVNKSKPAAKQTDVMISGRFRYVYILAFGAVQLDHTFS